LFPARKLLSDMANGDLNPLPSLFTYYDLTGAVG